jgi:hypothetical protein
MLYKCSGWCNNWVTRQHARYNTQNSIYKLDLTGTQFGQVTRVLWKKILKFQAWREAEMSNWAKKLPVFQEKFCACCYIILIIRVKLENHSAPPPLPSPPLPHFQFRYREFHQCLLIRKVNADHRHVTSCCGCLLTWPKKIRQFRRISSRQTNRSPVSRQRLVSSVSLMLP